MPRRPSVPGTRPSAVAGQDCEGSALKRCDSTEMPLVEAHDVIGPVAVRDHDQRAVREPEIEIRIT
jgi:hypothetical protein